MAVGGGGGGSGSGRRTRRRCRWRRSTRCVGGRGGQHEARVAERLEARGDGERVRRIERLTHARLDSKLLLEIERADPPRQVDHLARRAQRDPLPHAIGALDDLDNVAVELRLQLRLGQLGDQVFALHQALQVAPVKDRAPRLRVRQPDRHARDDIVTQVEAERLNPARERHRRRDALGAEVVADAGLVALIKHEPIGRRVGIGHHLRRRRVEDAADPLGDAAEALEEAASARHRGGALAGAEAELARGAAQPHRPDNQDEQRRAHDRQHHDRPDPDLHCAQHRLRGHPGGLLDGPARRRQQRLGQRTDGRRKVGHISLRGDSWRRRRHHERAVLRRCPLLLIDASSHVRSIFAGSFSCRVLRTAGSTHFLRLDLIQVSKGRTVHAP